MPVTDLQRAVFAILRAQRSPDSYVAGGTLLNLTPGSPRYSDDVDLFHSGAEVVTRCAQADADALASSGFSVEWRLRQPGFQRADVSDNRGSVRLEWAVESAFRFFPVVSDPDLGWRLHPADAATNKVLALAGRAAVRDFVDVLNLHETYLPLGLLIWAACGKDAGLTPEMILSEATRCLRYDKESLARVDLARPLDALELRQRWQRALVQAREIWVTLPPESMGSLWIDEAGQPGAPDSHRELHRGSLGGAWPAIVEEDQTLGA